MRVKPQQHHYQQHKKKKRSAKQQRFKDRSRNSILFAGAAVMLYLLYGTAIEFDDGEEE